MSTSLKGVAKIIRNYLGPALFAFALMTIALQTQAARFPLPPANESLLGNIDYTATATGETPGIVARRYNLGVNAIVTANPGVTENTVFNKGASLKVATQFLLPPLPRQGIIINLPEMRIYYYPKEGGEVLTFPIGIGRVGKTIPITNTAVVRKVTNPVWTPPADIRQYNKERGINLPSSMPPGPDNPLGPYAIYLQVPTFLIHSTIFPESIGRRASFGCIRMNEYDIEQFFPLVKPGTPVTIINMPDKAGWKNNTLYFEAHPPLIEHANAATLDNAVSAIQHILPHHGVTLVNWQLVAYLAEQPDGIPHAIGVKVN